MMWFMAGEPIFIEPNNSADLDGSCSGLGRVRVLAVELERALISYADVTAEPPCLVPVPNVAAGIVGEFQQQAWALDVASVANVLAGAAERMSVIAAQAMADTDAHRCDAATTAGRWWERHGGLTRTDAQRLVRCGRVIRHLDDIRIAFHDNELRLAHIDAISRIVPSHLSATDQAIAWDAVGDIQADLIDAATHLGPTLFTKFCRLVRDRLDLDGPADRAAEPSRLWLSETFDGRWALTGDLCADDGALLATWLDKRRRTVLAQQRDPTVTNTNTDATAADRVPLSQIDAEALMGLVRDGAGTNKPGRIGAMLHIDLSDLTNLFDTPVPKHAAHTDANLDISTDTMWALLADADITPVFWDSGQPLTYGRTRRLAPDILRQVLAHRDRVCRIAGCDTPASRCHIHHTIHWDNGGVTNPDQTVNGCTSHHTGHHHGDWTVHYNADHDDTHTTRPDGTHINPTPRWQQHRRQRTRNAANHQAYLAQLAAALATRGVRTT